MFHLVLGGLEDLHLHRLPAQGALEFADPLLRRPQRAGRDHLLFRPHRHLPALRQQVRPALDQRPGDAQLATQLRRRDLTAQDALNLLTLELRRVAAIPPPTLALDGHVAHAPPPNR